MRALNLSAPLAWTEILRRTGVEVYTGNCFAWAATLAFFFFLALFPALLFVVSRASFRPMQGLRLDRMVTMLGHAAPHDVVAIARQQIQQIRAGAVSASSPSAWSAPSGACLRAWPR